MGVSLEKLKDNYAFKDITIGFSQGRRKFLRYAIESGYAWYTRINSNGPQPYEYLNYAKNNIALGNTQGAIDGISSAKRAIHLAIDALFDVWGLSIAFKRASFSAKLEIMNALNAFPVRMLKYLNQKRNLVEHEYKTIEIDEAADFVDVSEMFLMLSYPFLKHATISAFVGLENDNRCLEWQFDIESNRILVCEIMDCPFFDSSIGRVYYNFPHEGENKNVIQTIKIEMSNQNDWLVYLDLFVYFIKRCTSHLQEDGSKYPGLYINKPRSTLFLEAFSDSDE